MVLSIIGALPEAGPDGLVEAALGPQEPGGVHRERQLGQRARGGAELRAPRRR